MSWCPSCDEVFPEGPRCPRCGSRLSEEAPLERQAEQLGGNLPQLKVPRRVRRAFDRMSRDPAPPRQLVALAMAAVLFAGGFVLGRMGSISPDAPALPQLQAAPLPLPLDGFVEYVARPPGPANEPALVRHELQTGQITTVARFSLPFPPPAAGRVRTHLAALDDSSALVLAVAEKAFVGAFPADRALPLWMDAAAAGWETRESLVVLQDGSARRWRFADSSEGPEVLPGRWQALHATSAGVALESPSADARRLESSDGSFAPLPLPPDGEVLAVSPALDRALLTTADGVAWWDGSAATPLTAEGLEARRATFSPSGDEVAVVFAEPRRGTTVRIVLGIADPSGRVAFQPVTTTDEPCSAEPVWSASERWVYLAPGNGSVYAVEVGGGTVRGVHTRIVGCGLAWNA